MAGSLTAGERKKILSLSAGFFFVMGFSNVSYFLPVYYAQMGFSPKAAGLLVSAFFITSVALRPFMAGLIIKFGFRKILFSAGIISVLSSIGVALAGNSFWLALFSRAALGVGASFFQVGLATFQAVAFSESIRGRAFSLTMAGGLLPMMTLVPLADWLLFRDLHSIYILLPLISSVAALLMMPLIPDLGITKIPGAGGSRNYFSSLADCFKIPAFRVALFAFFLFCLVDATSAFMAAMTRHYGLMASFFLSSNALVGVCVRLFCARLLDRYPRWKLSLPSIMITAGTLLLASINPTRESLIVLGLIFGIGMGFGFPLHIALISDVVPQNLQPQAVSTAWFLMGFDFAVIPLLMGWMGTQTGPVATFQFICGLTLLGAVMSALMWARVMKK